MSALVERIRELLPDFTRRPMTFEDFLAACAREGLTVELKDHPLDEQLVRRPPAKIILKAGLSERYRTFAGFHALAHWFAHPGTQDFYLGSPGWLDQVELEASQIGLLALSAHAANEPLPVLRKARLEATQLEMWVEYPAAVVFNRRTNEVKRGRRVRARIGRLATSTTTETQEELPL